MNICVYGINSLSLHSKRNIYRSLVTTAFLFNYPDHPFREKGMAFFALVDGSLFYPLFCLLLTMCSTVSLIYIN